MRKAISKAFASVIITTALGATLGAQDDEQHTAWLVEVLQAKTGSVLADIGAGPDALLTIPLARHVGPSGRIYATELGAQSLEKLRATVAKAGVLNVQSLAGDPSNTNLPTECCDAIFVRFRLSPLR